MLSSASRTLDQPPVIIRHMGFSSSFACAVMLLLPLAVPAQVLISRRVYQEHGASYQQIWNYNPLDGALQPITHSTRNHFKPTCSSKTSILFTTSQPAPTAQTWSLNRATGVERLLSKKAMPDPHDTPTAHPPCSASAR